MISLNLNTVLEHFLICTYSSAKKTTFLAYFSKNALCTHEQMAAFLFSERVDAPDIAIVITDGLSRFPQLTRRQAERAKNESITIFAIGIGNDTDEHELEVIASGPQFKFSVGDYAALLKLDQVVAQRACGGTVFSCQGFELFACI